MKSWTVQCGYAAYYANTVTVEADTLEEALERAIDAAESDSSWKSIDYCGPTFVDAVAEGADADPWRDFMSAIPIPERFTEDGRAWDIALACDSASWADRKTELPPQGG